MEFQQRRGSYRGRGGRGRGRGRGRGNQYDGSSNADSGVMSRLGGPAREDDGSDRGHQSKRPFVGGSSNHISGEVDVRISGFSSANEQDYERLLQYLVNRRAGKPVDVLNVNLNNNILTVKVRHFGQANALKKLSGIHFDQQKLFIEILSSGDTNSQSNVFQSNADISMDQSNSSSSSIEVLGHFVTSRYDSSSKFLRLERILEDPIMVSANVRELNPLTMRVMLKLASEKCPDVAILSFADNNLRNLQYLSALPDFLPNIEALSLANNQIVGFRDIEYLDGTRLQKLRELNLQGNPIYRKVENTDRKADYRSNISSKFPSLANLDGEDLLRFVPAAIPVGIPVSVKGNFLDSEVTKSTILQFLSTYYNLYDTDRNKLLDLYHPMALFSCCNTSKQQSYYGGGRGRGRGDYDRGDRSDRDFIAYKNNNRNLFQTKDSNRRFDLIQHGPISIVNTLLNLPNTKHPFLQDPSKLIVDSWQIPSASLGREVQFQGAVLFLSIHSEFVEVPNNSNKSFDRAFMIVPADAASVAKGVPFQIVNDTLVIRSFTGNRAWVNAEGGTPLNGSVAAPAAAPPTTNIDLDPLKQQQVMALMQQTKLQQQWAVELLQNAHWNFEGAMKTFSEFMSKNMVPQHYFQS